MALSAALFSPTAYGKCKDIQKRLLDDVFNRLDNIRQGNAEVLAGDKRSEKYMNVIRKLSMAMKESGYFKDLDGAADFKITQALIDPQNAVIDSRVIFEKFVRVGDLEKAFDPGRVIELPIDVAQAKEIGSGLKTVTIRAGRKSDLKAGPGIFRVGGTNKEIPVEILNVSLKASVMELSENDLQGESPRLAKAVSGRSLGMAQMLVLQKLAEEHKGKFSHNDPVTVIHFRVLDSQAPSH